jgi:hypothetical protein
MRGFLDKERFDYLIPLPTRLRRKLAEVLEHTLAGFDKDVRPGEVSSLVQANRSGELVHGKDYALEAMLEVDGKKFCSVAVKGEPHRAAERPAYLRIKVYSAEWQAATHYTIPIQFILRGNNARLHGKYMLYAHYFSIDNAAPKCYVGITRRHWVTRYLEHVDISKRGARTLFHRIMRDYAGRISNMTHELIRVGMSEEEAFASEEELVDRCSLMPKGYNMIPGGRKGLAVLYQHGFLDQQNADPEAREDALTAYADSMASSRAGTPNAALAAYWADDAFAQRMICSQERRLTADQVRNIRRLHANGHSAEVIFAQIGGNDVGQILRVMDGRTYARVR